MSGWYDDGSEQEYQLEQKRRQAEAALLQERRTQEKPWLDWHSDNHGSASNQSENQIE
jgi:hypothetical protein